MPWRKKNVFGLEFRIHVSSAVTVCHFTPSNLGRWKPSRSCVGEESRYWPCRIRLWFSEWVEVRCLPWHHDLQFSFSHINVFFSGSSACSKAWWGGSKITAGGRFLHVWTKETSTEWICVFNWHGQKEGEEHVFCPGADFRAEKWTHTNLVLSWKHPLCDWELTHAVVHNKEERLARSWHNVWVY